MRKRAKRLNDGRSRAEGTPAEAQQTPPRASFGGNPIAAIVLPVLMLLSVLAIWFGPSPGLSDPWVDAAKDLGSPGETDAARRATFLKAAAELTRLTELYPRHARVHYSTAYALLMAGDLDGAIHHSRQAVRLGSGAVVNRVDVPAREVLVAASVQKSQPLMARRDFDAALRVLGAAREDAPDSLPIALNIGNALLLKNDPKAARGYFEQAVQLDPKNFQIHVTLATIYRAEGKIEKAIATLEEAVSLNPKDAAAPQMLAQLRVVSRAGK